MTDGPRASILAALGVVLDRQQPAADTTPRAALTALHVEILAAIRAAGDRGLTDTELADLPTLADRGTATLRRRRQELWAYRLLAAAGLRHRDTIWIARPEPLGGTQDTVDHTPIQTRHD